MSESFGHVSEHFTTPAEQQAKEQLMAELYEAGEAALLRAPSQDKTHVEIVGGGTFYKGNQFDYHYFVARPWDEVNGRRSTEGLEIRRYRSEYGMFDADILTIQADKSATIRHLQGPSERQTSQSVTLTRQVEPFLNPDHLRVGRIIDPDKEFVVDKPGKEGDNGPIKRIYSKKSLGYLGQIIKQKF